MEQFEPRRKVARPDLPVRRSTRIARPAPIGLEGGPVDAATAREIEASSGAPLPPTLRRAMEPLFERDLGDVRIHRNSDVAPQLGARAFTVGRDIHFASGEYRPSTSGGLRILAHELAHVGQQDRGTVHRWIDANAVQQALAAALDADAQRRVLIDQVDPSLTRLGGLLGYLGGDRKDQVQAQLNTLLVSAKAALAITPFAVGNAQNDVMALVQAANGFEVEALTAKELKDVDLRHPRA